MPKECPHCDYTSPSEHGLNTHIGKVHGKNQSQCERCGDQFELEPAREGEVRQCSECFERFGQLEDSVRARIENRRSYDGKQNPMYGRDGGFNGESHTEATKDLLSEKQKGSSNPFYGCTGEEHPTWKGGNEQTLMGSNWKEVREFVLERDFFACRSCRTTQEQAHEEFGFGLDVHHKTPRSYFLDEFESQTEALEKANRPHNLITVCRTCHRNMEVA